MAERNLQRPDGSRPRLFQVNRAAKTQDIDTRLDMQTSEINRILALMSGEISALRERLTALEEKTGG